MARKRKPTQNDIATAAGVSSAVVSLVINGRANGKIKISPRTQERVWDAVRELGYVPNLAARQLAGGRNHLIGVFTFESAFPVDANNFYYPFLVGIEQQAEALRYDLMLFTRSTSPGGRRSIYREGTNALQVADGSILVGTAEDRSEIARLKSDGYPFVYVGRREIEGYEIDYVGADYVSATRDLAAHAAKLGHRDIRYIGSPHVNESASDRESGFRQAVAGLGLASADPRIHRGISIDHALLRHWLESGTTAFLVENPTSAQQLSALADDLKLSIPGDFSIGVMGNVGDATQDLPWITSHLVPRVEMGSGAVRLLHDLLESPDTVTQRQYVLPCPLQPGSTVGPAPQRPREKGGS
jgi:DNA-binding LacI/PurR family transcriptional regulator